MRGCKQETLSQWHPAEAGAWYAATARVRARVSPGNMTFLIVTFLDEKGKYIGLGTIDRLPVSEKHGAKSTEQGAETGRDSREATRGSSVAKAMDDTAGEVDEWVELAVLVPAPKNAKQVGLGVRVLNQVSDDFAEFASLSLRELK